VYDDRSRIDPIRRLPKTAIEVAMSTAQNSDWVPTGGLVAYLTEFEANERRGDGRTLERQSTPETDPKGPSVIEKVQVLMEVLGAHSKPVGISAMARESGIAKSTVYRLCTELASWGVVERVGTSFQLGARLSELALTAPARDRFREIAVPYCVELYALTRRTANLSILVGTDVVCIDKFYGAVDTAQWVHVGTRAPAHSAAAGKAILAFSSQAVVVTVMSQPLRRVTPFTLASPQMLSNELGEIRRSGLAFCREEVRLGLASLAAPLFGRDGRVVGALALTSKSAGLTSPDVEASLKEQAHRLSQALRAH
jgi:DNA-binding IclR family transcriptional regulator